MTSVVEKLEILLLPIVNGAELGTDKPLVLGILKYLSFILKNAINKRYFLILEVGKFTHELLNAMSPSATCPYLFYRMFIYVSCYHRQLVNSCILQIPTLWIWLWKYFFIFPCPHYRLRHTTRTPGKKPQKFQLK